MAPQLRRNEPVGEGLRRLAIAELDQLTARWQQAQQLDEAVHQFRKRCKRLRALLRLLQPLADGAAAQRRWFRDAARELSGWRDAAVLLDTWQRLGRQLTGPQLTAAHATVSQRLQAKADAPAAERPEQIRRQQLDRLAEARRRLQAWTTPPPTDSPMLDQAARTYRRTRRAYRQARRQPSDAALHQWRKRIKELSYQWRLLQDAWKPRLKPMRKTATRLGELLGEDHDLAVCQQFLQQQTADLIDAWAIEAFTQLAQQRRQWLQQQAFTLGRTLLRKKPRRFEKQLRRQWRRWRKK